MTEENKKYLKEVITASGCENPDFVLIEKFLEHLLIKNLELNLMSRKLEINQIILEHIYDCLSGFNFFNDYNIITDFGTGGGFPGLLLAIIFKDKTIHLVEKSGKKIEYLKDMIQHLGLNNVILFNCLSIEYKEKTDCITCRGFKPINELLKMTEKYIKQKTHYVLYKGTLETINNEIEQISKIKINKPIIIKIAPLIYAKERNLVLIN